jgi:hypothetical protein
MLLPVEFCSRDFIELLLLLLLLLLLEVGEVQDEFELLELDIEFVWWFEVVVCVGVDSALFFQAL